MQWDCYRCGKPVDEKAAFCPACKAPQIRVLAKPPEPDDFHPEEEPNVPPPPPSAAPPPPPAQVARIQWGLFFRIASPMAAISGLLSALFLPVGLLFMLPLGIRRAIARYRPLHPGLLQRRQGAQLGAFSALLSFLAFLIFFLATISLNRAALLQKLQERVQQNPSPQAQEALRMASTPEGFIAAMVFVLFIFLVFFLLVGMASGALAFPSSRSQPRP